MNPQFNQPKGSTAVVTNKLAIARAYNFKDDYIIFSNDTTTLLDNKRVIYDLVAQKSWGKPTSIPNGAKIVSVTGSTLVYSPGNVSIEMTTVPGSTETLLGLLNAETGAEISGWKRKAFTTPVDNVAEMLSAQLVNIWEFVHLITNKPTPTNPNTWDWTPAFQGALDYLDNGGLNPGVSGGCILFPAMNKNMIYRITEIVVPLSIAIFGQGATIAPFNYQTTHTHLIKFMGMNKVTGIQISMEYSVSYECAIWCRGRNLDFVSCAVWFAKNAVTVGEPSWATDPLNSWLGDSEISFSNCQFNWCLRTASVYGLNTIVFFGAGSRCYSNPGAIPSGHPNEATWAAAPRGNFINFGALVYIVGAAIGTFTRDVPSLTSRAVPTTVTDYVPSYGRFIVEGTHIETSFLFYAPAESGFTPADDTTRVLEVHNCHGHVATSPTDLYWINAATMMKQSISVSGNNFYGSAGVTPTRTKLISAPGALVDISQNANDWACISGEIKAACNIITPMNRPDMQLVTAFGSAQGVTTSATTLIMPSIGEIDLVPAARTSYYNATTGQFTAAVEMHNVEILVDLRYVSPASTNTVTLNLVVAGATVDSVVLAGAYGRVLLRTRRIAKGATFNITMVGAAAYTLDGTANTKLSLTATV